MCVLDTNCKRVQVKSSTCSRTLEKHLHRHEISLICISVCVILQSLYARMMVKRKKRHLTEQRNPTLFLSSKRLVMGVLDYFQVIKYKMCRCVKKKHKSRNNNDRGAVLSLDDVKRHVSRLLLSTLTVSDCIALTGAHSLLCLHRSEGVRSERG